MPGEVALVHKPGFKGRVCDFPSFSEKGLGSVHSDLGQIGVRWEPQFLSEDPDKVKGAKMGQRGQLI